MPNRVEAEGALGLHSPYKLLVVCVAGGYWEGSSHTSSGRLYLTIATLCTQTWALVRAREPRSG